MEIPGGWLVKMDKFSMDVFDALTKVTDISRTITLCKDEADEEKSNYSSVFCFFISVYLTTSL